MSSRLRSLLVGLSRDAFSWEKELDKSLGKLGEALFHLLREGHRGPFATLPTERKEKTEQLIKDAKLHARIVDAAGRLIHFLQQSSAEVVEFDVPSRSRESINTRQAFVDGLDAQGLIPGRGFVYVPWIGRPSRVLYVGRAKGSERLSLRRHGALASALSEATTLSFLVPPQSTQAALAEIEASVIEVVHTTIGWPKHNRREETPPFFDGSRDVDRVAQLLNDVARKLAPDNRSRVSSSIGATPRQAQRS